LQELRQKKLYASESPASAIGNAWGNRMGRL
jgi:hypothetical protein